VGGILGYEREKLPKWENFFVLGMPRWIVGEKLDKEKTRFYPSLLKLF